MCIDHVKSKPELIRYISAYLGICTSRAIPSFELVPEGDTRLQRVGLCISQVQNDAQLGIGMGILILVYIYLSRLGT